MAGSYGGWWWSSPSRGGGARGGQSRWAQEVVRAMQEAEKEPHHRLGSEERSGSTTLMRGRGGGTQVWGRGVNWRR